MANGYTIYFLIIGIVSSLTCFLFTAIIFRTFLKKRTIGTLLLTLTFFSTTIAEVLLCTSFFWETFTNGPFRIEVIQFLSFTAYIFFAFNPVLIYVFGDRLLLKDNDLVRLIYIAGFSFTLAYPAGLVYKNIFLLKDPSLFTNVFLEAQKLTLIFPIKSIVLLAILAPLGISAFLRIVIKAIRIQRGTKEPIAKKGFQFIWQGTFLWYIGYTGLFAMIWFIPIFSENVIFSTLLFSFKLIFSDIIGFALLYLGWVQPNWFKRRFRKKAWINRVYSGKEVVQPSANTRSYISTSTTNITRTTNSNKEFKAIEVSDQ